MQELAKSAVVLEQMRAQDLRLAAKAAIEKERLLVSGRKARHAAREARRQAESSQAEDDEARRAARAHHALQCARDRQDTEAWLAQCVESARATAAAERLRLRTVLAAAELEAEEAESRRARASSAVQHEFEHMLRAVAECRSRLEVVRAGAHAADLPSALPEVMAPAAGAARNPWPFDRDRTEAWAEEMWSQMEEDARRYGTVTVRTAQGMAFARYLPEES